LDIVTLKDLPIPLAAILIAFYLINQNNAEFAKKLVALIAEFTSKYEMLLKTATDDHQESRDRWLERDRQLIEALNRNTEAHVKNANETHALRNMVQPLVLSVEAERKRSRGTRSSGDNPNAAA
jgi:hypothetical protein